VTELWDWEKLSQPGWFGSSGRHHDQGGGQIDRRVPGDGGQAYIVAS